jgi:uncharacterized protein (DUF2252 family)
LRRDPADGRRKRPLFLQLKEASTSVLEAYAGKSVYSNHGERVVMGHRLMQSASDIFLGWITGRSGRHFYVRQLRDAKMTPKVETFNSMDMIVFAQWCGHSLARSHARSGDAALISGYLGESDTLSQSFPLPMQIKPSATTPRSKRQPAKDGLRY